MNERRTVVKALAADCPQARKKDKGEILDRFVSATGYNRAYGASLLRNHGQRIRIGSRLVLVGEVTKRPRCRKRKRPYDEPVQKELIRFWRILDLLSGMRLAPTLPGLIATLERHGELALDGEVREKRLAIRPATIDRLLLATRKCLNLRRTSKPNQVHCSSARCRSELTRIGMRGVQAWSRSA